MSAKELSFVGKCAVCSQVTDVFTCCSSMGAFSLSYCRICLGNRAEPEFTFAFCEVMCGNDVSAWVRKCTTHKDGQYISWDDWIIRDDRFKALQIVGD
jgi:hypothetical protein